MGFIFTSDHIEKNQTIQELQELQKLKYFVSGIKANKGHYFIYRILQTCKTRRTINKSISYNKINFIHWLHVYLPSPTTTSAPRYKWFWILKLFCQVLWEKKPTNPKSLNWFHWPESRPGSCTVSYCSLCSGGNRASPLGIWNTSWRSPRAPWCEESLAWIKQNSATAHSKRERVLWSPASLHLWHILQFLQNEREPAVLSKSKMGKPVRFKGKLAFLQYGYRNLDCNKGNKKETGNSQCCISILWSLFYLL